MPDPARPDAEPLVAMPTAAPEPDDATPGEPDESLAEHVAALVADGQRGLVLGVVADLRPADLASLLRHLPDDCAQTLVRWIPSEATAEAVAELDSTDREALLEGLSTAELVVLLDHLDTDDAADVLADVDEERSDEVLGQLADADDVEALLRYGEDTAGGLMGTEYVAVPETATIAEATEAVRQAAEAVDPVYVVYLLDAAERLVGTVPLKRLLLAPADAPVAAQAERDVVSVGPDVDQEEVARVMERYDLIALPVVSASGRLLGRITIDDVVDVIREEAEEDLQRAVGISGDEELSSSVFAVSRGRIGWLLLGLVGAYASGLVIVGFEQALQVAPVLALFIPIVMSMAGNAGVQSSAIAVQGLASGDLWQSDLAGRLAKELAVALVNGAVLALALAGVVAATGLGADSARLALTAGVALMIVIVIATLTGATIPLVLARLRIDPALAMGPFILVTNDILGLSIFFVVATILYL